MTNPGGQESNPFSRADPNQKTDPKEHDGTLRLESPTGEVNMFNGYDLLKLPLLEQVNNGVPEVRVDLNNLVLDGIAMGMLRKAYETSMLRHKGMKITGVSDHMRSPFENMGLDGLVKTSEEFYQDD